MITKRIIPCLDVKDGRVVKGVNFEGLNDVNSPIELAEYYTNSGADELVFYDITASAEGRSLFTDILRQTASRVFIPLTVGGGIRTMDTVRRYLEAGASRVILGTAAATDPDFTAAAVAKYGEQIAVGADLKDGKVAIKGWLETTGETGEGFLARMQELGVKTVICTDVSKDGAMQGTNRALYKTLAEKFSMDIIASGGVSTLEDIRALRDLGAAGAIIGKAYYTGDIDLKKALEVAR